MHNIVPFKAKIIDVYQGTPVSYQVHFINNYEAIIKYHNMIILNIGYWYRKIT